VEIGAKLTMYWNQLSPGLGLIKRDREVALLMSKGLSSIQVAGPIAVSRSVTKLHVRNILGIFSQSRRGVGFKRPQRFLIFQYKVPPSGVDKYSPVGRCDRGVFILG
jgi:DNA-binding CsgD family transcriptional regulator